MNKKHIIIFTCAAIFLSQNTLSFAWSIPGVTRPYDPANYWTRNTVSWPDSRPSVYTLRDIARNGGNVIDHMNLEPNTVKDVKAVMDFAKRLQELLTDIKNLTPFGRDSVENMERFLNTVQPVNGVVERTEDSYRYMADGSDSSNAQVFNKGLDSKYIFLDEAYRGAYVYAKQEAAASEERAAALTDAVQRIEDAEGRLAAAQSQTEIAALSAAALQERNKLIAQRNALAVLKNRADNDDIIRAETNIRNQLAMQFYDPYRPTDYDKTVYTRKPAPGLPAFAE